MALEWGLMGRVIQRNTEKTKGEDIGRDCEVVIDGKIGRGVIEIQLD